MKKVFIVKSIEMIAYVPYYHIEGVFSTLELAQRFLKLDKEEEKQIIDEHIVDTWVLKEKMV